MLKIEKIFSYLILLVPLFLITGPAIPDIVITFGVIFGIFYIINEKYWWLFKINIIKISLIFWIGILFISLFAYNRFDSFVDSSIFIRFLLIPIFIYFIFFRENKIFEITLIVIFFLVMFVCLDSAYQFLNYTSENGFGEDLLGFKSNWYGRLTGPFGDELIPGSYVSKFGLLGFALLISKKKLESKTIIHSIYLSFVLLVCYISGERMAFATFGLGLLILFIFLDGFRKSIVFSFIIGFLFIFLIIYLHPFYNDFKILESTEYHQGQKIEKYFKCNDDSEEICSKIINIQPSFFKVINNFSSSAYGEIYLLSYKMFLDNPITGIGINNFKYLCDNEDAYKNMMTYYNCASHPHNIYLQWLTEGGLIVFILFIIYLATLIFFIINNVGEKKYKIISLAVILIMFWPVMSTGSLIKNWYGVSTFFIIGICMCLSKFKNSY